MPGRRRPARRAGQRLKGVRLAAGYGKQKELADALGVAAGTYSKWELGDRRPPNHILARIKELTSATADYLFLGDLFGLPVHLYRKVVNDEKNGSAI